jgi:hypothetical protein
LLAISRDNIILNFEYIDPPDIILSKASKESMQFMFCYGSIELVWSLSLWGYLEA